ncbi:hypothetical protein F383_38399 [Gossypium arboreum]|uniref:Uncharacterized protein n=1 Tax=Gossypium arboreum TaxID=29729 RepID=A0A0B0MGA6_GOSAR|nr:hypothetical protein F383_38399 [Gossypium arboreum]
MDVNVQTR